MNDEQRKEIRQQFWDKDYFDGLPNKGELLKHFINEYGKAIERQQQAEIEALKAKMLLNNYDDVKNVANQLFNEKISLRDYFAAKAMQGLIAGCYSGNNSGFTVEGNVFAAYEYADEMMKVGKSD